MKRRNWVTLASGLALGILIGQLAPTSRARIAPEADKHGNASRAAEIAGKRMSAPSLTIPAAAPLLRDLVSTARDAPAKAAAKNRECWQRGALQNGAYALIAVEAEIAAGGDLAVRLNELATKPAEATAVLRALAEISPELALQTLARMRAEPESKAVFSLFESLPSSLQALAEATLKELPPRRAASAKAGWLANTACDGPGAVARYLSSLSRAEQTMLGPHEYRDVVRKRLAEFSAAPEDQLPGRLRTELRTAKVAAAPESLITRWDSLGSGEMEAERDGIQVTQNRQGLDQLLTAALPLRTAAQQNLYSAGIYARARMELAGGGAWPGTQIETWLSRLPECSHKDHVQHWLAELREVHEFSQSMAPPGDK